LNQQEGSESKSNRQRDRYVSTSYSSNVVCGVCGAPLHNVPAMYENIAIDWRCGRCLRRDRPADDQGT
jgi:hypothetical protein